MADNTHLQPRIHGRKRSSSGVAWRSVNIAIERDHLASINALCEHLGRTRSQALRLWVEIGRLKTLLRMIERPDAAERNTPEQLAQAREHAEELLPELEAVAYEPKPPEVGGLR